MVQRKSKTAAAAHRKSGHGPKAFFAFDAVFFFYKRHQFLEEKVLVQPGSRCVIGIAAAGGIGVGHHDDHGRGFTLPDRLIGNIQYFAKLHPARLVITATVQQIEHRIGSC